MNHQELLDHCLAKPGAWVDEPWEGTHVVKVDQKIFVFLAFVGDPSRDGVALKCGLREEADTWLERFPGDARPMPYLARSGWNSLATGGAIPDDEILDAIDESYERVVTALPKSRRPAGWDAG